MSEADHVNEPVAERIVEIPAIVFGCLFPGELRIVVYPGLGMANGGFDWDVPVNDVPIELRMPNTPLWLRFDQVDRKILSVRRRTVDDPVPPTPRRRWFRFSLRTFFVVVTIIGLWLGYQLNWIRQRHDALHKWIGRTESRADDPFGPGPTPIVAPGLLWLFGEPGYALVYRPVPDKEAADQGEDELRKVERLFPEARVYWELPLLDDIPIYYPPTH